jgi:hypothetical protein
VSSPRWRARRIRAGQRRSEERESLGWALAVIMLAVALPLDILDAYVDADLVVITASMHVGSLLALAYCRYHHNRDVADPPNVD